MHQAAAAPSTDRNMLTNPADQAQDKTPVTTLTHAEFNDTACSGSLTPSSFVSYDEDELEDVSSPNRASWRARPSVLVRMMMIAFITIKSSLVPLIEGLCAQI